MILLYHKVDLEEKTLWYVTADTFDRQMAALQAFEVVHLDDYDPKNPRHAVITFDGIYENIWRYAAPILEKWGYPFELFVIGDYIGGTNAFDTVEPLQNFATLEMLDDLTRRGARLQWHSASHTRMDGMAERELARELDVPGALRERFKEPHWSWFAYPHDINHSKDVDGRIAAGVKSRFSGSLAVNAGSGADRYGLNRLTVFEKTKIPGSRVSIIIANYNYGRFLAEAIDSVLRQTQPPDEILVIDDASTDESHAVLEAFADRVRIEINERNLGIVDNFRKAVSLTSGDYIGFLGADNRMRSDYVEQTRAALDSHPGAAVAYTDMAIFGPLATPLAIKVGAKAAVTEGFYQWRFPDPSADGVNISRRNFIHGSSLYRRAWYDRVGGYRKSGLAEDHDLFRRMLEEGGAAVRVPHCLIEYRQHAREQANSVLNLQLRIAALERTNRELKETLASAGILSKTLKTLFEIEKSSPHLRMRPHTRLTWTDDGPEIEGTNDDPGLLVSIPDNRSKLIGVRAIIKVEEAGIAQFYSQTSEEKSVNGDSAILRPVRRGWNFLSLSIHRDNPVRLVRFDPSNHPGRFLLHELTIFTT